MELRGRAAGLWSRVPAPVLMVVAIAAVQSGTALGKELSGAAGVLGVPGLRLGFAALVLLALWRPRLPAGWRQWTLVAGLGTAIAGMNLIYPAMAHLPVGAAVTLLYLGPLSVALARCRRPRDLIWTGLAGLGVWTFYRPAGAGPAPGVLLALLAAAAMAGYLLFNRRVGAASRDGSLLAWAVAFGAALWLPVGAATAGAAMLRPGVLAAGLGVGVLSAVLPYSLELVALRRMPVRVVATLESLEPVAAGAAGLLVLGEHLSGWQWLSIGCVSVASVGAGLSGGRRATTKAPDLVAAVPAGRGGGASPAPGAAGQVSSRQR